VKHEIAAVISINNVCHVRNQPLLGYLSELGIHRESRACSFSVAKVFSEVSSSLLDIRRSEENDRMPSGSGSVFLVVLFASPDVLSKLLTSLNISITGKDRAQVSQARYGSEFLPLILQHSFQFVFHKNRF
jgi:hypothetical protein